MPCASSSSSSASPSQPGNEKWALPGRRSTGSPLSTASGTAARTRADQLVAQRADAVAANSCWPFTADLDGDGERDDAGHVQGAGADVALLPAAVQQRRAGDVPAEQQRADADRAAELVPGDGQRGRAGGGEVDRHLTDRLDRVGVERHAVRGGERGQLGHRLDACRPRCWPTWR